MRVNVWLDWWWNCGWIWQWEIGFVWRIAAVQREERQRSRREDEGKTASILSQDSNQLNQANFCYEIREKLAWFKRFESWLNFIAEISHNFTSTFHLHIQFNECSSRGNLIQERTMLPSAPIAIHLEALLSLMAHSLSSQFQRTFPLWSDAPSNTQDVLVMQGCLWRSLALTG